MPDFDVHTFFTWLKEDGPQRPRRPGTPPCDADGQPLPQFNAARRNDRSLHELLGMLKGFLADGSVHPKEILFLAQWLTANADNNAGWPVDIVADRVLRALRDDQIDEEECIGLAELFRDVVGRDEKVPLGENASTDLPLTKPAPSLSFQELRYIFTGKFFYGTRRQCEQAIIDRGGSCVSRPSMNTDVLVIGDIGSRDWLHTSFGTKISDAMDNIRRGAKTVIVCEQHWVKHL